MKRSELFEKAQQYRQQGNYEAARDILESLFEQAPENLSVMLVLGDTYREMEQIEKAIECFRNATQKNPTDEIASLCLFHALCRAKALADALSEMMRFEQIAASEDYARMRAAILDFFQELKKGRSDDLSLRDLSDDDIQLIQSEIDQYRRDNNVT